MAPVSDDEDLGVESREPGSVGPVRAKETPSADDFDGDGVNGDAAEHGNGDEEEDELDDDVFIVEAIKKHMVDEDGSLKFQVKWEGWDAKTDLTWEPEENLEENAAEILEEYFEKVGGRLKIFEQTSAAAKGKKRMRPSQSSSTGSSKRPRKNGVHPAKAARSATAKKWSPPAGSWEDEIDKIDAFEDEGDGKLIVFLLWKNGQKTKHRTAVVYKKCPQKMLQFYEQHVRIVRDEKELADSYKS